MLAMQEQLQAVVGDVAFDFIATDTCARLVGVEKFLDLAARSVEFFLLPHVACPPIIVLLMRIGMAMFVQDEVNGSVDLFFFLF